MNPLDLTPQVIVLQSNPSIWECISVIAAICAGAGAIAAFIVSFITYRRNKAPDLIAYLETNNDAGTLGLVVKNLGNGSAYSISLNGFDNTIVDPRFLPKIENSFISNGIPMLAPHQQRDTAICMMEYAKSHFYNNYELTLTWKKKANAKRSNSAKFILDYTSFANSLYTKSDLHFIRKDLDSINKKISNNIQRVYDSLLMENRGVHDR